MPIGPYPTVRLAHQVGFTGEAHGITFCYRVQPITIKRPAEGHSTSTITCATCGQSVKLHVYSVEETRKRTRNRLIYPPVVCVVMILVGMTITFGHIAGGSARGLPALIGILSIGPGMLIPLFCKNEDGVVVEYSPLHSLQNRGLRPTANPPQFYS